MVNILTVTKQSGNCDKLVTENDMLKLKSAKNENTSTNIPYFFGSHNM